MFYLYFRLFGLDGLAEEEEVLHKGGKLRHIPYSVKHGRLGLLRLRRFGGHLLMGSLSGWHGG